jgi:hypothetical protein
MTKVKEIIRRILVTPAPPLGRGGLDENTVALGLPQEFQALTFHANAAPSS